MNTTADVTREVTNSNWLKVSLNDWVNNQKSLSAMSEEQGRPLTLVITGADELDFGQAGIEAIEVVVIEFADAMDGRGFSQAAMLREKFNFDGRIHAVNVLEDNVAFMQQCGFDTFELESGRMLSCETGVEDQNPPSPVGFAAKLNRLNFDQGAS